MQRFVNTLSMIILLGSAILWAGCGGGKVQPSEPSVTLLDKATISVPEWFSDIPEDSDYLYSATTATHEDIQSAIDIAKTAGRSDIASQVETKVAALFKRFTEEVGIGEDSEIMAMTTVVSKDVVAESLKMAKTLKQDVRKESANVWRAYVLMKMSIWEANVTLIDKVKANKNMYARFKASQVFKELDEGVWEYNEVELSALDDAVHKAANSLIRANIDSDIRSIAVVEINRSGPKDKEARKDAKARIALREALDDLASNRFSIKNIELDADDRIFGRISAKEHTQQLHLFMSEADWAESFTGYPYRSKMSAVGWSFVPGGGQWYNFNVTKAIVLGGLEIIGIGAAIKSHLDYSDAQNRYMDATKITDISRYGDEANTLYERRNLVSIAPAAILLYNMCDAYLSARKYQKMRFSD